MWNPAIELDWTFLSSNSCDSCEERQDRFASHHINNIGTGLFEKLTTWKGISIVLKNRSCKATNVGNHLSGHLISSVDNYPETGNQFVCHLTRTPGKKVDLFRLWQNLRLFHIEWK